MKKIELERKIEKKETKIEEVTKEIAELTKKVMSEPPGENYNLMRNYLDDLRRSLDDLWQDKARLLKDLGSEPGLLIFLLLVVGCWLLAGLAMGWRLEICEIIPSLSTAESFIKSKPWLVCFSLFLVS